MIGGETSVKAVILVLHGINLTLSGKIGLWKTSIMSVNPDMHGIKLAPSGAVGPRETRFNTIIPGRHGIFRHLAMRLVQERPTSLAIVLSMHGILLEYVSSIHQI